MIFYHSPIILFKKLLQLFILWLCLNILFGILMIQKLKILCPSTILWYNFIFKYHLVICNHFIVYYMYEALVTFCLVIIF